MKTINRRTYLPITLILLAFGLSAAITTPAAAQRTPGMVGIGGQLGEPSGLTLKLYNPTAASAEFLAAWDFEDYVFVNGHAIYERHLGRRGTAHFFFGPGGFLEFRDRPGDQDDDVSAGLSGKVGLGVLLDRFELYGHLSPRLKVTPAVDGEMGGGVGFRVYF